MDIQVKKITELRESKTRFETMNLKSELGDMQKWMQNTLKSSKVDIKSRRNLARTANNLSSIVEKSPSFSPQTRSVSQLSQHHN